MSSWLLCPMELHCDWKIAASNIQDDKTLSIDVKEFRSKKSVAAVAEPRIRGTADNENQWKTFDLRENTV